MKEKESTYINGNKKININFFKRLKRAIFNVEKYGEFLLEKTRVAVKFFLILVFILSTILAIVSTYNFNKVANKAYNYIINELPDFTYNNGAIEFSNYAEGYDKDLDFYNIIDTKTEMTEDVKDNYKNKIKEYTHAIVFLSDSVIIAEGGELIEKSYSDLDAMYDINISNKSDLVNILNSVGIYGISITYFIAIIITHTLTSILVYIPDIFMLCLFGYLMSKIAGVPLNSYKTIILAVYSMTLSVILKAAYSIAYMLTGFYIESFSIVYFLIAYIYMIAAILIIKSDLIKQQIELQKIYKVEAEVKKELQEQKEKDDETENDSEKEKRKKNKDKKEEDGPVINREPDGSEI